MSLDTIPPTPDSNRTGQTLRALARTAGLVLLVAAVSALVTYAVVDWRMQQEQQNAAQQVAALRAELQQRQEQLEAKVQQVEKAAEGARLLLNKDGNLTSLDARLAEIDTLKLDLKKTQEAVDGKFKTLEQSVAEQVARQGRETAQALSLELRWKSLLIKAQGEVLLAQMHWAEGNRGLAKDELNVAARTLTQAMEEAPEATRPAVRQVVDLAEKAKSALILEQSSARDSLNLLWHRVSDLLGPAQAQ